MRQLETLLVVLACLLAVPKLSAQWILNNTFDSPPREIKFLEDVGAPQTGFVGLDNGELWRTTDGGTTWKRTQIQASISPVATITFKDRMTGWCGTHNGTINALFQTQDGGLTWTQTPIVANMAGGAYNHASGRLFISTWDNHRGIGTSFSTDDGFTWNLIDLDQFNGFEFVSPQFGILSNVTGVNRGVYLITNDAGITWHSVSAPYAAWQTGSQAGTMNFFAASEETSRFVSSSDGGETWIERSIFSSQGLGPTGCTRVDSCGNIYIQNIANVFWESNDGGATWRPIGGPTNDIDTRFTIADGKIWAGSAAGSLYVCSLIGSVNNTPYLQFSSNQNQISVHVPDIIPIWIRLPHPLPNGTPLDSLHLVITFDADVISPVLVNGLQGFTATIWWQRGNEFHFTLVRPSRNPLPADSALARIDFQSFVSRNSYSSIRLQQIEFNTDTILTNRCTALSRGYDSLLIQLNPMCPDSTLRGSLRGEPLLQAFIISPNPAELKANAHILLSQDAIVQIELTNQLGNNEGVLFEGTLNKGDHTVDLVFPEETGFYFVTLKAKTSADLQPMRETREVVVLR